MMNSFKEKSGSGKKKKTLVEKLRGWVTRRRKGAYVAHHHEEEFLSPHGPYTNSELVDTFSVEEDLDSCCQGLLNKDRPRWFDSSPVLADLSLPDSTEENVRSDMVSFDKGTKIQDSHIRGSKQESLESLDSLAGSHRDVDDEYSLDTPKVDNRTSDAYKEHVNFLRVATQPRQVELVWKTKASEASH